MTIRNILLLKTSYLLLWHAGVRVVIFLMFLGFSIKLFMT